jgi:hypothetical protein
VPQMRKLVGLLRRPVVIVALIGGIATIAASAIGALNEYRLKAGSERAAADVRVAQLFAELVPTANGRGKDYVTANGIENAEVGEATQAAAIRSLGSLGTRYEVLHEPARAALETLSYVQHNNDLESVRRRALEELED